MERRDLKNYGFLYENKQLRITKKDYQDIMLYFLDLKLFGGKTLESEIIELFTPNAITFREGGIIYTEDDISTCVSPMFFTKILIEKVTKSFYYFNYALELPTFSNKSDYEDVDPKMCKHKDFSKLYNMAKHVVKSYSKRTGGKKAFHGEKQNLLLRKLEIGNYVQNFLEEELQQIVNECFSEDINIKYNYENVPGNSLAIEKENKEHYLFEMSEITDRLSGILEDKMTAGTYTIVRDRNVKINELGLDEIDYVFHPNDESLPYRQLTKDAYPKCKKYGTRQISSGKDYDYI